MLSTLAMTARADNDNKDRDGRGPFHKEEHREGRAEHIPVVPETNPAPVLGGLFLIGALAYEARRRFKKA